jgi:hypothetical protein
VKRLKHSLTPSIEKIVIEYQRSEELSRFHNKFVNNLGDMFQHQPQFESM